MNDFLNKLEDKYKDLTPEFNLTLVAKGCSPEFGGSAFLIYCDDVVSLMITKSRDGIICYCSDGDWQNDNWYSMDIIWNYLKRNPEYRKMKTENHFSFFKENFNQIANIFQQDEKDHATKELHKLELSRSKTLFG